MGRLSVGTRLTNAQARKEGKRLEEYLTQQVECPNCLARHPLLERALTEDNQVIITVCPECKRRLQVTYWLNFDADIPFVYEIKVLPG